MQSCRQDCSQFRANGPCTPGVPIPRSRGILEVASGSNGMSSILVAAKPTDMIVLLPESQSERPKRALRALADDEPVPMLGAAKLCLLPGGSAFPAQSVPPLLAEPPALGRKRLHVLNRLEHCRGFSLCVRCGFISVTKARELTRFCTGHPTINTPEHLDRGAQGLLPKVALTWQEDFEGLA